MVSEPESALKRSLKNLYHIWLLLCLAALLSGILYLNQVTSHTHLFLEGEHYHLRTRQCQELTDFSAPQTQAPVYYPLWLKVQKGFDTLHQRPELTCQKAQKTPSSPI